MYKCQRHWYTEDGTTAFVSNDCFPLQVKGQASAVVIPGAGLNMDSITASPHMVRMASSLLLGGNQGGGVGGAGESLLSEFSSQNRFPRTSFSNRHQWIVTSKLSLQVAKCVSVGSARCRKQPCPGCYACFSFGSPGGWETVLLLQRPRPSQRLVHQGGQDTGRNGTRFFEDKCQGIVKFNQC